MAQLVLKPSIHDFSREEVEAFLEVVRNKRMSAAIEYHANANARIGHEIDKVQKKFQHQVEMLARDIEKLEAAELRVENRLYNIDLLKQEMGLLTDQITDPNPDTVDADED